MPSEPNSQPTAHQRLLKKAFANRRKQNFRISLRAFAKDLEISHSYLLDLQSGRRKLTLKRALKILPKLKLTAKDQHLFLESVREGSLLETSTESDALKDVSDISVFTNWYNIAIITLAGIPKRPITCMTVVKDLGISLEQATEAVAYLCAAGYLEARENGTYIRSANAWDVIRIRESAENPLLDQYSKQVLDLATGSLRKDPAAERVMSSTIFTMNASQFALLEERIQMLCYDVMSEFVNATGISTHNRVYLLATQLVPLAKWT